MDLFLRMRKTTTIYLCLIGLFCSCIEQRKDSSVAESENDTVEIYIQQEDSLLLEEDTAEVLLVEKHIPIRADELFDDFIFNYASDEEVQIERTVFPLPYYENDSILKIEKQDWVYNHLFSDYDYYTILFDKEEDMDFSYDASLNSVQFEWYLLEPRSVIQRYYFERKEGVWLLEGVGEFSIPKKDGGDFISFFHRFSTDSLFQRERVIEPLVFVTSDPDDDFEIVETTISFGQWNAFKPILPQEKFTNINYGQRNNVDSRQKIVSFKGIGNGFSNTLYFRLIDGKWMLSKFEDTSN